MKNIKFLFVFSMLALLLFACEKDYEPLNDFSDVEWYTSAFRNEKQVAIDKYMSFSDLSYNALEHTWSFSAESGCKFLTGNIKHSDTTYTKYIDTEKIGDTITTDQTIHVLFTKPGLQKIHFRNTFPHYVEFKGNDTLAAVKEGNVWVIDTTFIVDVFDSIQSSFKVFKENVEIANVAFDQQVKLADTASWPTVEIMAGEALKFVDMSTVGRPNSRTWYFGGGTPATSGDSVASVNFYRLGTFYARMESRRVGENIPGGYKMKYIPLKIKVNRSNLPLGKVGDIVELQDEKIQIAVSGELAAFAGKESDFTVHVTNQNGFDQDIPVQLAKVSSSSGTIIELKLAQPIYNSDVVTVSYVGNTIQSLDEREMDAFTTAPVKMYAPELIPYGGFEDGGSKWVKGSDHVAANINEYSMNNPFDGNYCMHLNTIAAGRNSVVNTTLFPMKKGVTYKLSWRVKVVAATGGGYEIRLNRNGTIDDRWQGNWTGYKTPDNIWRYEQKILTFDENDQQMGVQILSYHITETYWDNLSLIVWEARP